VTRLLKLKSDIQLIKLKTAYFARKIITKCLINNLSSGGKDA
jgi:hypothetical protein